MHLSINCMPHHPPGAVGGDLTDRKFKFPTVWESLVIKSPHLKAFSYLIYMGVWSNQRWNSPPQRVVWRSRPFVGNKSATHAGLRYARLPKGRVFLSDKSNLLPTAPGKEEEIWMHGGKGDWLGMGWGEGVESGIQLIGALMVMIWPL